MPTVQSIVSLIDHSIGKQNKERESQQCQPFIWLACQLVLAEQQKGKKKGQGKPGHQWFSSFAWQPTCQNQKGSRKAEGMPCLWCCSSGMSLQPWMTPKKQQRRADTDGSVDHLFDQLFDWKAKKENKSWQCQLFIWLACQLVLAKWKKGRNKDRGSQDIDSLVPLLGNQLAKSKKEAEKQRGCLVVCSLLLLWSVVATLNDTQKTKKSQCQQFDWLSLWSSGMLEK